MALRIDLAMLSACTLSSTSSTHGAGGHDHNRRAGSATSRPPDRRRLRVGACVRSFRRCESGSPGSDTARFSAQRGPRSPKDHVARPTRFPAPPPRRPPRSGHTFGPAAPSHGGAGPPTQRTPIPFRLVTARAAAPHLHPRRTGPCRVTSGPGSTRAATPGSRGRRTEIGGRGASRLPASNSLTPWFVTASDPKLRPHGCNGLVDRLTVAGNTPANRPRRSNPKCATNYPGQAPRPDRGRPRGDRFRHHRRGRRRQRLDRAHLTGDRIRVCQRQHHRNQHHRRLRPPRRCQPDPTRALTVRCRRSGNRSQPGLPRGDPDHRRRQVHRGRRRRRQPGVGAAREAGRQPQAAARPRHPIGRYPARQRRRSRRPGLRRQRRPDRLRLHRVHARPERPSVAWPTPRSPFPTGPSPATSCSTPPAPTWSAPGSPPR